MQVIQHQNASSSFYQPNIFDEIVADNFAGGGGASIGIELAIGRPVDIAINHSEDAITMHKVNHPYTQHYKENVWNIDPKQITEGRPVGIAWFSPDCKHFSRAKGATPIDKNIRGLAWVTLRWAATVRPRIIFLENVKEFMTWGPVRRGKPVKSKRGQTFRRFVEQLRALGYKVEWNILKACDYGAPTNRERFYLIARCDGNPIVWPEPTYGDGKQPYRTAAECIDWTIPCTSIFGRKKNLAPNTLRRIAKGLVKFVIKDEEPFIMQVNCENPPRNINASLSAIAPADKHYTVAPSLIHYHSEKSSKEVRGQKLTQPLQKIDTRARYGLVAAYLTKYYGGEKQAGASLNAPLPTVTAIDHNALVESHICVFERNVDCKTLNESLPTITQANKFAQIQTYLVKASPSQDIGNWDAIRELLNTYTELFIPEDEILILNIRGEEYFIYDIAMRMLKPAELAEAQGFPTDYCIDIESKIGVPYSVGKQTARIGNAVCPPVTEKFWVSISGTHFFYSLQFPPLSIATRNYAQLNCSARFELKSAFIENEKLNLPTFHFTIGAQLLLIKKEITTPNFKLRISFAISYYIIQFLRLAKYFIFVRVAPSQLVDEQFFIRDVSVTIPDLDRWINHGYRVVVHWYHVVEIDDAILSVCDFDEINLIFHIEVFCLWRTQWCIILSSVYI